MASADDIVLLSSDEENTVPNLKNRSLPVKRTVDETTLRSPSIYKKVKFGANEICLLPPDDQYYWPETSTVTVSDNVPNGNEEPTSSKLPVCSTTTASTTVTNATSTKDKPKSKPSQSKTTIKTKKVIKPKKVNEKSTATPTFVTPKYKEAVLPKRKIPEPSLKSTNNHKYIPFLSGYKLDSRKTSIPSTSTATPVSSVTLEECQDFINQVVSEINKPKKSSKSGLTIETTTTIPLSIESIENNLSDQILSNQEFDINTIKSTTLRAFLSQCISSAVEHSIIEEIRPRIRPMYANFKKINEYYRRSNDLKAQLNEYGAQIERNPQRVLEYFDVVYELLDGKSTQPACETEIDKLVDCLHQLSQKINKLENSELDFDDENNSTYIQEDFYKKKYCSIYMRWCKKTNQFYYRGRATHKRLDYAESKYPQINSAINEMYRKRFEFPSYDLIDQVIRKCVEQHKIHIAPSELTHEIGKIFRDVGRERQNRRIHDTVDCLCDYLGSERDPAFQDKELDSKLKEQVKDGNKKIQEVFDLYAKKQTEGQEGNCSDSDNVGQEGSDTENDNSDTENETGWGDMDSGNDPDLIRGTNFDVEIGNSSDDNATHFKSNLSTIGNPECYTFDENTPNPMNNANIDYNDFDFVFVDNFVLDNLSMKTDTRIDSETDEIVLSD